MQNLLALTDADFFLIIPRQFSISTREISFKELHGALEIQSAEIAKECTQKTQKNAFKICDFFVFAIVESYSRHL